MNKPANSSHFHEGRRAFEREEWDQAIRAFRAAIHADRHHAESYLSLIRAYEAAAEETEHPEMFENAAQTCREVRKLDLDARQRAIVDEVADRVAERLRDLKDEEA